MADLSLKIRKAENMLANNRGGSVYTGASPATGSSGKANNGKDEQLEKLVRDSNKIAGEEISGLLASVLKERIFDFTSLRTGTCGHDHEKTTSITSA